MSNKEIENENSESTNVDFYTEKDVLGFEKPDLNEPDHSEKNASAKIDLYKDFKFPTLLQRVQALFVDVFIIVVVFIITSYLIDVADGAPNWLRATIFIFLFFLYEPVLVSTLGATIGHKALGLRIKSIEDPNKNLFIFLAFFRTFLKWFFGWLSFFTVTFNKRRRAIHDIGSGSIIISLK